MEFINPGPTPLTITGWFFSDSQPLTNNHTFYFTVPTTLQPGQIITVSEGALDSEFSFGLNGSDGIILNNQNGFEVERYTWTTHVSSSGRCPDGTGAFRAMTPTKGQPNACSSDGGTD